MKIWQKTICEARIGLERIQGRMDEESEMASRNIPFDKFCCKELKEME